MAMEKLFQLQILALKYCPKLLEIIHSSRRIRCIDIKFDLQNMQNIYVRYIVKKIKISNNK